MLNELQESVAHQLKNKLISIQAYAHLAIEERDDRQETCINGLDFLREIEALSRDMSSLLQQMLETQALEQGLRLHPERANITEITRKIVAANQGQAAVKGITLHFSTQTPYYADIDVYRMGEALDNLVSNAIKYSPPRTSVWISVRPDHTNGVCIEVRDEGRGFTRQDRPALFAKYQRLSALPTGGESSTGLGLAIAKQIVELHGGTLSAESKGPHQGSVFRICISTSIRTPAYESV